MCITHELSLWSSSPRKQLCLIRRPAFLVDTARLDLEVMRFPSFHLEQVRSMRVEDRELDPLRCPRHWRIPPTETQPTRRRAHALRARGDHHGVGDSDAADRQRDGAQPEQLGRRRESGIESVLQLRYLPSDVTRLDRSPTEVRADQRHVCLVRLLLQQDADVGRVTEAESKWFSNYKPCLFFLSNLVPI